LSYPPSQSYGGRVEFVYTHVLGGFAIEAPEGVALAISRDSRVAYVEQAVPVTPVDTQPNPPSWGLDRVDQRNRPLDSAYTYNVTGAGVRVYVIDSGIRFSHVDFGGRAVLGADFIGDGRNGNDCLGHGTHVAGSIGGSSYGVAKGVTLYAVRVFDCTIFGDSNRTIAAVNWVTANHVKPAVANMSLGGPVDSAMDTAVHDSINAGITYVIAAGNGDVDAGTRSPARVAEGITVGATDISDVRATFSLSERSNYGSVLDVFAPGKDIVSAYYTSDTATASLRGTSMAAPHVAGAVALYLQTDTGASPATVGAALVSNATVNVVSDAGPGSPNRLLYTPWIGAPPPPGGTDVLGPGEALFAGQSKTSTDGRFQFLYQSDGNLVLYRWDGVPLWDSQTAGTSPGQALMQLDGNFVVYDSNGIGLKASNTAGNSGAYLIVQNDGNVVIYSSGGSFLWSTGTCCY